MHHPTRVTRHEVRVTHLVARITGSTRLVGVIGWPVSHSRSPRMHNAAFAALGLDWAYVPLPVAPERVGDAVRGLVALGFAGANVTVPHKQAVLPFLDELTPVARAIGAVNTIVVRPDGSLLGESTDGAGFMADLQSHDVLVGEGQRIEADKRIVSGLPPVAASPHPRVPASPCRRVLVIGAGGTARSVVYALAEAGASVAVVNRTLATAQELCQTIGAALRFTAETQRTRKDSVVLCDLSVSAVDSSFAWGAAGPLSAYPLPDALPALAAAADLIVNTTSLGLHEGDPMPWEASVGFRPGQTVYDLIYNRPTEFLALARSQGATAIDGMGMLVHQGARAFELWTGETAPIEVMMEALRDS